MIYKFGNPAATLTVYLRKKWGWPGEGLANPHNSAGKVRPMQDGREKKAFLASKYIPTGIHRNIAPGHR